MGQSVRLVARDAESNEHANMEFEVGDVWEVETAVLSHRPPPHTEDVLVQHKVRLAPMAGLIPFIKTHMPPKVGGPDVLFDGLVQARTLGAMYISEKGGIPTYSTLFWQSDQPLIRDTEGKRIRYRYPTADGGRTLTFVGFQEPPETIPAGTLLRVSLAHWWQPENRPAEEPRCYLQLSGWFLPTYDDDLWLNDVPLNHVIEPAPPLPTKQPISGSTLSSETQNIRLAIIECVASLPGELPRSGVGRLLRGSHSERVADYQGHPSFGIFANHRQKTLVKQVDALLQEGILVKLNGRKLRLHANTDESTPTPQPFAAPTKSPNLPISQSPISTPHSPHQALQTIFGYDNFRPLQAEIIHNILKKQDTLVVMPTGGGKSLCYQIPALLFDGLTVVVSPLISLMQDQVSHLQAVGITAVFLNSTLTYHQYLETSHAIRQGHVKLLYVAPETLLRPETLLLLEQSHLACLAIDEAHCISQWGHDFRPEYRQLVTVRQRLPHIVTIALTATATPRVQQDIQQSLNFQECNTFLASFDRPNLFIEVAAKTNTRDQILHFIAAHPNQSGIIYCATRKTVDTLTEALTSHGIAALPYHAGLDNATRSHNQTAFIRDDVPIMVATTAFGMGIDKPDVRFVLHTDLPQTMEDYYQQIGRAGRDGLRSNCLLLFGYGDVVTVRHFIEQGAESERRGREARLQTMVRWAETAVCRRQQLLAYFGESYPKDNCQMCDNCLRQKPATDDLTTSAQKFLSCVYRTGQLYGQNHIIDVLRGSRSQKVLQKEHHHLSTYNIGREFSKNEWQHLARQFIQQGLLVQDQEHGSLKLTGAAWSVLKNGAKVWGQLAAQETVSAVGETAVYNPTLFHLLRQKRKELADQANVPPYVIFPDRALQEMATYFPHSANTFSQLHGIGHAKVERYAEIFLPLIRDFCTQNNLSEKPKIPPPRPAAPPRRTPTGKTRPEVIGERFKQGESVDTLAANYHVKRQTIIIYLGKYVEMGHNLSLNQVRAESGLEAERQTAVLETLANLGPERLAPVFQAFNEQIPYEELWLMRLIYWLKQRNSPI